MINADKVLEKFTQENDFYNQTIQGGIEKNRKGDLNITVKDGTGATVEGATVKINQKNHEFRFGANIFMLDEMESNEKNDEYKKRFAELFNMATLPFYWDALEPEKGKPRYDKNSPKVYRRPSPDLCLEFCKEHGIEPREHALAYDNFFPKWLYEASVDECKKELERRYAEISSRYAGDIPTIEVTNEMEWEKGKTAFYNQNDYVEWCFKLAEKYFPNNTLCINEWTGLCWEDRCRATDKYYSYIQANMLKGARIDAVGMQYHLFFRSENFYDKTRRLLDPKSLFGHMDLYASLGKPLQITEVTVPSYSWEKEDEQLQAEIIEKLYSTWFAHPAVEQIVYWNLVDGYAHVWDPDPAKIAATQGNMTLGENYYHGGLLRFDMTPKPAYYKIKQLLQKTWHTEDEKKTSSLGTASFRGFYGDYEVEITANGKTVTKQISLSKNAKGDFTLTIE